VVVVGPIEGMLPIDMVDCGEVGATVVVVVVGVVVGIIVVDVVVGVVAPVVVVPLDIIIIVVASILGAL